MQLFIIARISNHEMAIDNYTLHYINYKKENLIYTRNSLFVSQSIKNIKSSGSAISRYWLLKIHRTEMRINLRRRPNSWRFAMRYYNVITDCVWDQWAATSLQFQMDGVVHMDFLSTIFVKIHWKTNSKIQFCILVFKKKKKKFFFLSVCNVNDSCLKKIVLKQLTCWFALLVCFIGVISTVVKGVALCGGIHTSIISTSPPSI